jgi:hypothetical protein
MSAAPTGVYKELRRPESTMYEVATTVFHSGDMKLARANMRKGDT